MVKLTAARVESVDKTIGGDLSDGNSRPKVEAAKLSRDPALSELTELRVISR